MEAAGRSPNLNLSVKHNLIYHLLYISNCCMGRKPRPGFTLTLKYPALHLSNACSSYAQAVKKWKSSTGLDSTKAQQLKPRGDCRDFEGPKATALGHHHPTGTAGQLFYCFSISGPLKTVEGIKDSEDNCFPLLPLLAAVRQSPDFPRLWLKNSPRHV